MSNLVEIKTKEPNEMLIDRIKSLLKEAESGELQGIVGAVIYENGNASEFWVAAPKDYHINLISDRILGCFERIKYDLLSQRYGVESEDSWRT